MKNYERKINVDLNKWMKKMRKKPSLIEKSSKGVQNKINNIYPEKFHAIMTSAIKKMTQAVIFGSEYTSKTPCIHLSLEERDVLANQVIKKYKTIAMVEGAGTGAGGIMMGLADFPLLLSIKIKLLYEIAAIYGLNTKDFKERIYILTIFELAFSSQSHVREVFKRVEHWAEYKQRLGNELEEFDWRTFQREYRDYLDIAKLMQMLPFIGAPVGAVVNNRLVDKLGKTAIQAYHMRWMLK